MTRSPGPPGARSASRPSCRWQASAAMAVDLETGGVLFERNADLPLAPDSNEKLIVTFAALRDVFTF